MKRGNNQNPWAWTALANLLFIQHASTCRTGTSEQLLFLLVLLSNICSARDIPLPPVTTKEGMCPRDNSGPAGASRKTAKCSVPNGKKVGTSGYKKLYCLCLMGWKSQKGKRNNRRQNAVGITFISKIAKLNFSLGVWQMCRAASTLHTDVSEFQEVLSPKW